MKVHRFNTNYIVTQGMSLNMTELQLSVLQIKDTMQILPVTIGSPNREIESSYAYKFFTSKKKRKPTANNVPEWLLLISCCNFKQNI